MAEVDAREMQPAGKQRNERKERPAQPEPATKPNRFAAIFTGVEFKPYQRAQDKPLVFSDGTEQTRLAIALVKIGDTGAYVTGAHIVRRKHKAGGSDFLFQWPSAGGKFKTPMIGTEDEHADADLQAFNADLVEEWKAWQIARVKAGQVSTAKHRIGVAANDAELAELGLTV